VGAGTESFPWGVLRGVSKKAHPDRVNLPGALWSKDSVAFWKDSEGKIDEKLGRGPGGGALEEEKKILEGKNILFFSDWGHLDEENLWKKPREGR